MITENRVLWNNSKEKLNAILNLPKFTTQSAIIYKIMYFITEFEK